MLLVAAHNLDQQKDMVNALNVFPVPDGDTGTNMSLTLNSALKELDRGDISKIPRLTSLFARGSLMGARGNSGVILSQFFRGFSDGLADVKNDASGEDVARALVSASKTTYRAVMKPVEGTMLTVARVASEYAQEASEEGANAVDVIRAALKGAQESLANTPNILPVLKEAGVVDAGGQGLVCIFEGFLTGLTTSPEDLEEQLAQPITPALEEAERPRLDQEVMVNKYCTEFIILGDDIDPSYVRGELESQGDSMIVVGDAGVVKVHIHTDHPGQVLQFCSELGNLTEIAIDNMFLQNQDFAQHSENHHLDYGPENAGGSSQTEALGQPKPVGIVAVVAGEGLAEIFRSLGVDHVVTGGQTMNPSTEDLVTAVNSVHAESVIILPNNKNVIFSAQQVKELVEKKVGVVPTRSAPQGISALMYFVADDSLEENVEAMEGSMREVKTGEVTYAVRSTVAGDLQIEERDIIGLAEGKIAVVGASPDLVALDLLRGMIDDQSTVISIYFGAEKTEEEAVELRTILSEEYPDCEIEVYSGGQPLYYYIVSVE
jgi:DAK2 domain fusion protein YloV